MTDRYCANTGDNSDGTSWAKAKTTLTAVLALCSAGDRVFVASNHSETTNANVTLATHGTAAAPVFIIGADQTTGTPPTAVKRGASVVCNGTTSQLTIENTAAGHSYWFGIDFKNGVSGNVSQINVGSSGGTNTIFLDDCTLQLLGDSGTYITSGVAGVQSYVIARNLGIKFSAAGQVLQFKAGTFWDIDGLTLLSGGTSPNTLTMSNGGRAIVRNVDASNGAAGIDIHDPSQASSDVVFIGLKVPSSWTGELLRQEPDQGCRISAYAFGSPTGANNYDAWVETEQGTIRVETGRVLTGGASDGTTPISWKMTARAGWNVFPLQATISNEISSEWNDTLTSITATVEILHDSATNLKDDEAWLELNYFDSASNPVGVLVTDRKATVLTTAADQDASSAPWDTTGMSTPNAQKLSVTFTPGIPGVLSARVRLCKDSKTIYVNPKLDLS